MMSERAEVLRAIIGFSRPIAELTQAVRTLPWDSPGPLASLTSADASCVLRRYLDGGLSAAEIEEWANLIEGREDIGYESGRVEVLTELVNELANPVTMGILTQQRAQAWLRRMTP